MARGGQRPLARIGWNVWRGVVGVFYLAAAIFNTVYTLPKTDEPALLDGYADGAWFPFIENFTRDVLMPNDQLLMLLVIAFEVAVGLLILSHGVRVDVGVAASVLWVLAILPFLAWPYLLTNIALVVLQGMLLLRRYDTSIWTLIRNAGHSRRASHAT